MARVKGVSKNPEQARQKIIDSALKAFGKHGYSSASTEQIAERAGYSQATIFFHFKTKAGLLKACLEEARTRAWGSLPDTAHLGVLDLVKRLDDRFEDPVIAAFFSKLMIENRTSSTFRPIYASYHAHIRNMIRDEIVRETAASAKDALQAAGSILCMLMGVHGSYTIESELFSRTDYSAMLLKNAQLIIDDLRQRAPKGAAARTAATPR
ncbi:TetR/AcrR family transcriptional regulator [Bradyrhizobium sp. U87765 SZCCT0131]|uniref:TetR/AcrR family transcriptional regulator n=1 Tax=unclassified Bradyrhizobium TaxID=2631580 RepID=UPI001BAD9691|nr:MULTISPECIES: TetR/AcrR family transcriptional regulator [unclassified Bradyrhizobium]MBR1220652.1 TetR/AcrR family transcriptional regulator [Bradyrhizobium sp. U87765 SZCCT0131]MBR1262894.1 TetR/AcrR family transcriptional regulator [Bradyrhizobium sp. U87765 SZCCT0134]MBR1307224.1 TetR/AcrR family transcriptional regulator [Bradyrhizobium sp. U87765 SZCCT0110]MBR1322889.1 TetR/AcrR family transcriptional regulator [Bradyrhizobium sp. U87765 SZCCT0109]MBR1346178.1 TetR/AcrR family transcr